MVKMLADEKPVPGDGFANRQRNYEILQRAVQQTVEARQKDPIAFAMQNPAFGFKPINDFANGQAVAQELGKRRDSMGRIAGDYGTRPAVLTDKEAEAFGQYLGTLQTPDKARTLGAVAAAAGAPGVQSISAQLRDKDNTLAIAALLSGKRETFTHWLGRPDTYGPDAALLYLEGKDAIAQKRARIDETAETGVKAEIFKAIDGVYQTPQERDFAAEAAYGIYGKLKADGNDDVEHAVQLATGGLMDFNGGKIAKPYGWDDDRFRDAMRETVPARVKDTGGDFIAGGQKVSAADFAKGLPGATLKTAKEMGTYLVMKGNDVVRNLDGTPYILKVAQ
jgi:hypothetical protein